MPSPANPHLPRRSSRALAKGGEPTAALFVRIPTEHARRLDRAAFELRVPKQSLVSELVERYVNPDSPASLMSLGRGWGTGFAAGSSGATHPTMPEACSNEDGRRRVTVETLDQGELTVGHHSFRPRDPEVLTPDEAAELLQVDPDVVLDLARGGELPGRELAGEWRFARAALLAWLATGTADADAKG
jgi:excisionase family DNA binding protein